MTTIHQPGESGLDPAQLANRSDVDATTEERIHEEMDHCSEDIAGRVVISVQNEFGEQLLLIHEDHEIALRRTTRSKRTKSGPRTRQRRWRV